MTAHACRLPHYHRTEPHRCNTCGTWWTVVTFHDHEKGHSWQGWDRMPEAES